jgi:heme-degrading monooxygenase HmoA
VFARVSVYDIPEGRADQAAKPFADALRRISGAGGLVEAYFLVSGESGRGVVVTIWDDHNAMAASRVAATGLRGAAIAAVGGQVVSVEEFRVAAHVRPGQG